MNSKISQPIYLLISRGHSTSHPYSSKKYSSKELAHQLVKNVLYNKNGITVFNKPFGVSFSDGPQESKDFEVNLHTLLPFLKEKMNTKKLFPSKVPEKYASGVAIFSADETLHNKIRKCIRSMRGRNIPPDVFDCITVGMITSNKGQFNGGVTLETSGDGKQKRIKLIEKCSKTSIKEGKVKNTLINHETVFCNKLASRLRISITRPKWHALRVYAATHLVSPLLGDRVFGGLVRSVLGKSILIDPWSPASSQPQRLSQDLLAKLELASREDIEIPLHMHLTKVTLADFPAKGGVLEFFAEPPDFFKWTCFKLHLDEEIESSFKSFRKKSSMKA